MNALQADLPCVADYAVGTLDVDRDLLFSATMGNEQVTASKCRKGTVRVWVVDSFPVDVRIV